MKVEGMAASGGGWGGDVKVGRVRFELRERPVRESPTRIRNLPPELEEEVIKAKARKKKPGRRVQSHNYDRRGRQPSTTSQETIDEIVRLYQTGLKASDVARRLEISHTTVLRYLKETETPIRGNRKPTDVDTAGVVKAYEAGDGLVAVGKAFGISSKHVREILTDTGTPVRSKGGWRAVRGQREDR